MLDEHLIREVQKHAVIYNRQKHFLNDSESDPAKYLNKEDAWQEVAFKLNTDVETCKKRWKYLRERYVQQRKQGDSPSYEHLSRPYLEKMKFLDKHIQPRKSYKHVINLLSSPNGNGSFPEFLDSSRSNGTLGNPVYQHNYQENNFVKTEFETPFQNFANLSHQRLQQNSHRLHQQSTNDFISNETSPKRRSEHRDGEMIHIPCPSSSSSIKSRLSSSPAAEHNNDNDLKRPRIDATSIKDDSSENEETVRDLSPNLHYNLNQRLASSQNELLLAMNQQFSQTNLIKCSEQLLGELVTSELLKMNKERKKIARRRILEILFFDD